MKDVNVLKNSGVNVEAALEVLGDMDDYDETLSDFLSEIDEKVSSLNKYKEENDMANYAIYAHSIKSDSKYLGFAKLASIALAHEMAGKENNVEFVNSDYANFISEINRIIEVSKLYLG